jgi:Secretion system C-terminal sorting domain/Regulator of chromosome condensation (RCC1) repeat
MKKIITILVFTFYCIQIKAQCFSKISASNNFTTAIKTNGTLWAWGHNLSGQLGDGTLTDRSTPVQIGTATNWQKIASGDLHSLAIKTDGTLWAWGFNSSGQLGNNSTTNSLIPIQIGTSTNWQSISAGSLFSLALKTDGTLWAWGDNYYKQLGLGALVPNQLVPVQVGTDNDWYIISAGANHSLASKLSGPLYSWGNNSFGQLGLGFTGSGQNIPTFVSSGVFWKSISAGGIHNLAIKDDNTLWAWGNNSSGELGDNTTILRNTPVQIGTDTNWFSVETGSNISAALKATGTLWTWGYNHKGQLGDNTLIDKHIPTQLGTATYWATISAGGWQMVARVNSSIFNINTYSWGDNTYGDGTTTDRLVPTLINNCTTLANDTFSTTQIKIYPNPATNALHIENQDGIDIEQIRIINLLGETVLIETSTFETINIEKLATGMYVLEVVANGKIINNKFIKQ